MWNFIWTLKNIQEGLKGKQVSFNFTLIRKTRMRLRPIRRPAFNLDCISLKNSKLKEYNPLLDNNLKSFYLGYGVKGILLNN